MPWRCPTCALDVTTDLAACPGCGGAKTAWTLHQERTRTFRVAPGKRFELLRGDGPGGLAEAARVPTDRARSVALEVARGLADRGETPPPADVLFVRLHGRGKAKPLVRLTPLPAQGEALDVERGPLGETGEGPVDVPFLLVRAAGAALPDVPGVHAVDVSDGEGGVVPAVEVAALGRPARRLALGGPHLLSAVLFDRDLRGTLADVELEVEGTLVRTDAGGRVTVAGQPCADLRVTIAGETLLVPSVHDARLVVRVRVPWVERGAGARPAPQEGPGFDPTPGPCEVEHGGEALPDDEPAPHEECTHDAVAGEERRGVLSAQLVDGEGRRPLAGVRATCLGHELVADARGVVQLDDVPADDLLVEVEGGHLVVVPAVHDARLVARVRVPGSSAPAPSSGPPPSFESTAGAVPSAGPLEESPVEAAPPDEPFELATCEHGGAHP